MVFEKRGESSVKPGEEYYKEMAYYPRLDSLISGLVELLLRRSDITTLKQIKTEYTALSRSVTASLYPEENQKRTPGFD